MTRIAILSSSFGVYTPEAVERLRSIAEVVRIELKGRSLSEDESIEILRGFDILILGGGCIVTERVLRETGLKVVARHGVGLDNVDVEAATKLGVPVLYTPHANSRAVAEHTFALILSFSRRITLAHEYVRRLRASPPKLIGFELEGKKLGVIGFGAIGRLVAGIGKGFGMLILVYDPYVDPKIIEDYGCRPVDLETLLRESDIVTIHVPLTRETYHMIGERELKLMKPTALIVNTSRGAVIDESILVKALREGWIAGAALDVFEEEPLKPENPLLSMDNVVATPHIAFLTVESVRRMDTMLVEDIERILSGRKPLRIANPKVLEKLPLI
ncbi:MAG: hydroxyacid dehydrogenase [Candidatus Bathyarchaeia archaeon]